MRARTASIAFLLLAASAAIAQEKTQGGFPWQEPDRVVVEATGEVSYQLISNPANFTVREFTSGTWRTSWYVPGTNLVWRYDEGDATIEMIYDKNEARIEDKTHIDGLTLIISTPNRLDVSVRDLGVLHRETRRDGRMSAIRDDRGNTFATFSYDGDGVFQRLTLADSSSFTVSRAGEHMLRTTIESGGTILDERTIHKNNGGHVGTGTSCLDVVEKLFSSQEGQTRTIPVARAPWINVIRDSKGQVLLYIVKHFEDEFGFDRSGKLVYAGLITWVSSPDDNASALRVNDVNYEMRAAVPERIIITADGRAGACFGDYDVAGAIHSFWLERTETTPTIAFR